MSKADSWAPPPIKRKLVQTLVINSDEDILRIETFWKGQLTNGSRATVQLDVQNARSTIDFKNPAQLRQWARMLDAAAQYIEEDDS